MPLGAGRMGGMARQAVDVELFEYRDNTSVLIEVHVDRRHFCNRIGGEIQIEIAKQIVAGHECIGIRKLAAARHSASQMALAANRNDLSRFSIRLGQ